MTDSVKEPKAVKIPPTFSVDESDLPEIKKWSVGKSYTLTIEAKMISQSQGDEWDDSVANTKKPLRARFSITGIRECDSDSVESKDKMDALKKRASEY